MFSDEIKNIAIYLGFQEKSYGEIADIFKLSRSTIQNLINYKNKWNKKKGGPKMSTDKRKSTVLTRYVQ